MKELIFVGRSIDNLALIFMDESGFEFNVPVDDHIKRSINNNVTGAAMMTNSTSGISPKDIQTRIRRGESVQAIASENGVSLERIARYAGPVLAERSYMASLAEKTLIRRPHGEVLLGELATGQLANRGIDTLTLVWDSYRRDDSRWTVSVSWNSGSGGGSANWIYDPLAKSVLALDDEARWLFGEAPGLDPASSNSGMHVDDQKRRLVGLPSVENGEEELEPPSWAGPGHPTIPVPMPVPSADKPVATKPSVARPVTAKPVTAKPVATKPAAAKPVAVIDDSPSWDDILFGHRPNDQ